jgi:23S rRNA (uracil1939-C5)-methyltransferase/tRNA (uracil-5-)-methyltransferase
VGKKKQTFNDHPFRYHEEIELEITTLTNLGSGLGRVILPAEEGAEAAPSGGWVVMVPFTLPGERVRARIFRNHRNFSEADLVAVLMPSLHRVQPGCPLFGRCGGCQYQHLAYAEQLKWKQQQVAELLQHMAAVEFPVSPVVGSPREYGYRSKITPHFAAPRRPDSATGRSTPGRHESAPKVPRSGLDGDREANVDGAFALPLSGPDVHLAGVPGSGSTSAGEESTAAEQETTIPAAVSAKVPAATAVSAGDERTDFPIGFLRQGTRFDIIDVPRCPIATEAINRRLAEVRAEVRARRDSYQRGATLLLREASGEVTTDYDAVITETIGSLRLRFLARDFFQNNPFILPAFTGYVRAQAAATGAKYLIDAYCGSGLFALAAAPAFERVAGVEISESSVRFARENATANGITNTRFQAGDASAIFAGLEFPPADSVVVIDPPRKGCDSSFLAQLFAFRPRAVVYVSCDPATQMRDLREFIGAGYELQAVQPFDLFPQTRHLECVLTLTRKPL